MANNMARCCGAIAKEANGETDDGNKVLVHAIKTEGKEEGSLPTPSQPSVAETIRMVKRMHGIAGRKQVGSNTLEYNIWLLETE